MNLISGGKGPKAGPTEALIAFVKSLDVHGKDEFSICSGVLDIIRAYMGDRPCCIWKSEGGRIEKVSERGMVEVFFSAETDEHQKSLARALASGALEFDPCHVSSVLPELKNGFDGFLHIPIKSQDVVIGLLTLAALKKEARNLSFVGPLESLGRLVGMAIQSGRDREANSTRETRLKAEVRATTRELEITNSKLIDRVKELKTLYKELQKRVTELTHANKAKNEFLSIVSHELRTPLTSLTGFLCVLLEGEAGDLNAEQLRFLKIIKQSADRLNLLISDLLDISRIESGRLNLQMKMFPLFDLLDGAVHNLTSSAEKKGVKLNLEASDALPEMWGDPNRIIQVVDNLISNAIKFTDAEGQVRVVAELKGEAVKISVIDSGVGLSKEEVDKVFDMFYQVDASTRRSTGGAGLGLAISRGIVALHGGDIWVESEKGQGANFSFILPLGKKKKMAA